MIIKLPSGISLVLDDTRLEWTEMNDDVIHYKFRDLANPSTIRLKRASALSSLAHETQILSAPQPLAAGSKKPKKNRTKKKMKVYHQPPPEKASREPILQTESSPAQPPEAQKSLANPAQSTQNCPKEDHPPAPRNEGSILVAHFRNPSLQSHLSSALRENIVQPQKPQTQTKLNGLKRRIPLSHSFQQNSSPQALQNIYTMINKNSPVED